MPWIPAESFANLRRECDRAELPRLDIRLVLRKATQSLSKALDAIQAPGWSRPSAPATTRVPT